MPLRIESRTYTVNPGDCKKSPSKFFIWKNLRCSVHEECRTEKINQQRSGPGVDEVAGLIEDNGNNDKTTSSVLPGSGSVTSGRSSSRRTRPLSLAVQPLNYHRLDPDNIITITTNCSNNKHPNMTSQESIGNCSLDVDRSASDRSEATIDSISERTLHSLNLSYNGDTSPAINTPINSDKDILTNNNNNNNTIKSPIIEISNGDNDTEQVVVVKKPSYLGLACSISGYSGITRYDSKLREGFRSRDSSPGSRLITRDSSPAGFRSSENLDIPSQLYQKNQSISPLAMDHQNGCFTNGNNKECKIQNFVDTRTNNNDNQGYTEVDRGVTLHTLGELSPIHGTSSKNVSYSRETTKTYTSNITFSSPKTTGKQQLTFNDTNKLNSSLNNYDNDSLLNSSTNSEKSFIQQRVERLYGPGALAQGFFFKRSSFNQSNSSNNSLNESRINNSNNSINNSINNNNNNNNSFIDNANTEESLKKLPVLRHLRPEFRAQLPVVSPRRPTDGTEQIIKPLQRLSIPIKKQDVNKSIVLIKTNDDNDTLKLNTSTITNIPDQQLAAPVVVLPVLETKINTNNGITEAKINIDDKKDGHYFIKLLKDEIKRLFALAESAEIELINGEQLPEEAAGKLRSAAGKARLLATQKMQQFEGLCHKNITQIPGEEFPTTDEDLAGFWDMVMLQVVQINDIFDHIDKLRKSQWQEIAVETKKSNIQNTNGNKRRITQLPKPKSTVNSEANRKVREAREQARRQMIEDRRKAMKTQVEPSVKIFAPKT